MAYIGSGVPQTPNILIRFTAIFLEYDNLLKTIMKELLRADNSGSPLALIPNVSA